MGNGINFTTVGGTYKAGDRRNLQGTTKWLKEFDSIDVAPKNGVLSPKEIVIYRDKQTSRARQLLNINKFVMFLKGKDISTLDDSLLKISKEEKITNYYRNVLNMEQSLKELKDKNLDCLQ